MGAGKDRSKQLNVGMPPGWRMSVLPKQVEVKRIPDKKVPLFAVVSTWHDADIVEACIDNCFEQGCERVWLLDNDSPDLSVPLGIRAGAEVAQVYRTDKYDDDFRIKLQNDFVAKKVEEMVLPDAWWMVLDSDEFPTSPVQGVKLSEWLSAMPPEIRVVGSDFIDLYPSSRDEYQIGEHPAKCMSVGTWRRGGKLRYCDCGHWKHPFVRFNGKRDIAWARGNHFIAVPPESFEKQYYEPMDTVVMFHAPLRRYEDAAKRLKALCSGRSSWDDDLTNNQGSIKRLKSLEAVYNGWWDRVDMPHTQMYGRTIVGIVPYPWRVLAPQMAGMFDKSETWFKKVEIPLV